MKNPLRGNKKAFVFDIFLISIALIVVMMVMVLLTLMWIQARPQLDALPGLVTVNTNGIAAINNFGNGFFEYSGDTILVFFYFMLVLATFISARYIGGDGNTLPVGLVLLIIAIIVSMPISDFAHKFLTTPSLAPAATFYTGTLYILDYLPVFTAILTIAYLVLVITKKSGTGGANIISG